MAVYTEIHVVGEDAPRLTVTAEFYDAAQGLEGGIKLTIGADFESRFVYDVRDVEGVAEALRRGADELLALAPPVPEEVPA